MVSIISVFLFTLLILKVTDAEICESEKIFLENDSMLGKKKTIDLVADRI